MNLVFMQLFALLRKNVRLLLRSKSSSAAILLGPLLVILVVGVVFSSSGFYQPVLGVYSDGFADLDAYVASLDEEFTIVLFEDEVSCIDATRRSRTNGCVVFFASRDAVVHIDPTDTSLIYTVLNSVSGQLDAQSGQLRAGLADQLLSSIASTGSVLASDQEVLLGVGERLSSQEEVLEVLASSFSALRVSGLSVSPSEVREALDEVVSSRDEYRDLADTVLVAHRNLARDYNDNASEEDNVLYRERFNDINDSFSDSFFDELVSSLESASEDISRTQQTSSQVQAGLADVRNSLLSTRQAVLGVASRSAAQADELEGLNITGEDIVSPLSTSVSAVTSEDDALFSMFPAFLALLVMFTTMLLSSQLVINERGSRAYFRNFITPTPDWLFVLSTYVTTLIVLLVQLILLFLITSLFTRVSVFSNFFTNFLLLFAIVTFFSFFGMLIGYFFKTQEGVMLSAISASSLFMLVSGLVLPVDTLPSVVRFFVHANPFVISSDLLTGSIVFGFGLGDLLVWFVVLVLYAVMLFAGIMLFQRVARVQYFESSKTASQVSAFLGESEVPPGKELRVGEYVIDSKQSLLKVLVSLSDEEYEEFADHQRNVFADWVRDVYKDDRLARLLRNTSRSGAITVLQNEL